MAKRGFTKHPRLLAALADGVEAAAPQLSLVTINNYLWSLSACFP